MHTGSSERQGPYGLIHPLPQTQHQNNRNHYNKASTAIVDSGTSLLVGPVDDVKQIAQVRIIGFQ